MTTDIKTFLLELRAKQPDLSATRLGWAALGRSRSEEYLEECMQAAREVFAEPKAETTKHHDKDLR